HPLHLLCLYCTLSHRHLHSFPTRRSSDLDPGGTSNCTRYLLVPVIAPGSGRSGSGIVPVPLAATWPSRVSRTTKTMSAASCCESDRKSTRLNSSHVSISYAVFCLKKKKKN